MAGYAWRCLLGGLIGVVATIAVGYIFWKIADKPARLEWTIEESAPVLNTSMTDIASVTGESLVRVMYGDAIVADPWISRIRIMNTGKVSLHEADFRTPLRITFGTGHRYLSSVLRVEVEGMTFTIDTGGEEQTSYELTPDLIKPGEYLDIQFLCDGEPDIHLFSRVDKIKELTQVASLDRISVLQLLRGVVKSFVTTSIEVALPIPISLPSSGKRR